MSFVDWMGQSRPEMRLEDEKTPTVAHTLSWGRMDGHTFRYSQAISVGICPCTLHTHRNLFQPYTLVSSFQGVWRGRKIDKLLCLMG